jgi:hypothetical protein
MERGSGTGNTGTPAANAASRKKGARPAARRAGREARGSTINRL